MNPVSCFPQKAGPEFTQLGAHSLELSVFHLFVLTSRGTLTVPIQRLNWLFRPSNEVLMSHQISSSEDMKCLPVIAGESLLPWAHIPHASKSPKPNPNPKPSQNLPPTHKEGEESAPTSSLHSTVSTVRVENVENAADGGGGRRGSASGGGHFRPVQAEIFTVEQHKSLLRCCSSAS